MGVYKYINYGGFNDIPTELTDFYKYICNNQKSFENNFSNYNNAINNLNQVSNILNTLTSEEDIAKFIDNKKNITIITNYKDMLEFIDSYDEKVNKSINYIKEKFVELQKNYKLDKNDKTQFKYVTEATQCYNKLMVDKKGLDYEMQKFRENNKNINIEKMLSSINEKKSRIIEIDDSNSCDETCVDNLFKDIIDLSLNINKDLDSLNEDKVKNLNRLLKIIKKKSAHISDNKATIDDKIKTYDELITRLKVLLKEQPKSCNDQCIYDLFREIGELEFNVNLNDISDIKNVINKIKEKLHNISQSEEKYYVKKDSEIIKEHVKKHEEWLAGAEKILNASSSNESIYKDTELYIKGLNLQDNTKEAYIELLPAIAKRDDLTDAQKISYMDEYKECAKLAEEVFNTKLNIDDKYQKIINNTITDNERDALIMKKNRFNEVINILSEKIKIYDSKADINDYKGNYSDVGFLSMRSDLKYSFINRNSARINTFIFIYNALKSLKEMLSLIKGYSKENDSNNIKDIYNKILDKHKEIVDYDNKHKSVRHDIKEIINDILEQAKVIHDASSNKSVSVPVPHYDKSSNESVSVPVPIYDKSSNESVSVPVPIYDINSDTSSNESASAPGLDVDAIFNYKPTKEERKQERLEDLSENIGIIATVGAVGGIGIVGLLGLLFSLLAPLCGLVICICLCLCIFYILRKKPKKV